MELPEYLNTENPTSEFIEELDEEHLVLRDTFEYILTHTDEFNSGQMSGASLPTREPSLGELIIPSVTFGRVACEEILIESKIVPLNTNGMINKIEKGSKPIADTYKEVKILLYEARTSSIDKAVLDIETDIEDEGVEFTILASILFGVLWQHEESEKRGEQNPKS